MKSTSSLGDIHRGTAVVELAVCLPVIVLLVFASLEGANMLFLRQAVIQSAYETAKSVAKTNGVQSRAVTLGEQVLFSRGIVTPTIIFNPANVTVLAPGTPFSVSVSVPGDSRSITGFGPFNGLTIRAQATMVKE
ncbi:MAG: TadE family protein [Aureliella sp.]